MNSTWGYNIKDDNYKSVETLIHLLVKAAGKNANLLLNVGPQPDGKLPVATVERLKGIGDWMRIYGETLYGTRGGIVRDWGVTTKKKDKLYVHILDWKDKVLFLPVTDVAIKKAFVFKDKSKLSFIQNKQGVILQLPELPSEIDYIVELQLKD